MVETTGLRFAPSLLSVMVSAFEGRAEGINFEPRLIYNQVRVFYFLLLFGVVQGGDERGLFLSFFLCEWRREWWRRRVDFPPVPVEAERGR